MNIGLKIKVVNEKKRVGTLLGGAAAMSTRTTVTDGTSGASVTHDTGAKF